MKYPLLSTLFIVALNLFKPSFAQKSGLPYDRFTGEITQTKSVQTGQSRDKAFSAARAWIRRTYPNYREVIRVEDAGLGRIVFQDQEPIVSESFKSFSYRVQVDIKDGFYNCTINNVKTRNAVSADYTSADADFSNIGMYGKHIDDIGREISITKSKKAKAKLYQQRRNIKSVLQDYHKSHYLMDLQFTMIQNGLREAVLGPGSLAAK
jgi:hypothetical protein